ncbi:hypothetical protein CO151_12800 [bacterium CG_4_9_14_3_um_filter_65_15]|nr:MAG: hypothetical protein CO151_12800 [bacterium CG_4_9_14_3_um_filter_65_15]
MKTLLTAVLLLSFALPCLANAGGDPLRYEVTWKQAPEAKVTELALADLAFEPSSRLGLGFPSQNPHNYYLFPQCGMGVVRLTVHWKDREPNEDEYLWGGTDTKIQVLQALGIDAFLTFEIDAEWAIEPSEDLAANHPPADMADWTEFMALCVDRYDGDGVNDMPELRKPVLYYQFINEWPSKNNLHGGWTGTLYQLIEFFNASYDVVKATDPNAHVVLGGISSIGLDAMVLNAGMGGYTARLSYNETVNDTLTVELCQDPSIAEAVADRERVLAESRYDIVDLHMYGPVEYNQYRIARIRQEVGNTPLITSECGGPNLAYDLDITPTEHFMTAMDMNLDALSRGLEFTMWLSMFGREYDPDNGPTWGNSQLQLIDENQQATGGFWGYHLLGALVEDMTSVEKPTPGTYIIHRTGKPDTYVIWQTGAETTYQLPASVHPEKMIVVTDAQFGRYEIQLPPADGLLPRGPLPLVVSEELPGGAYVAGEKPGLVRVLGR